MQAEKSKDEVSKRALALKLKGVKNGARSGNGSFWESANEEEERQRKQEEEK